MTPTEFAAWVGGGTALLMGIAKAVAYFMEAMGLRPTDRRALQERMVAELEQRVATLKAECAELERRIEELERLLREERMNVAWLERLLLRAGMRKTDKGWEGT